MMSTIVGPDVQSETRCRYCGVEYIGVYRGQYTCASEPCTHARHVDRDRQRSTNPVRVAQSRARNRAWRERTRNCVIRQPWLLGQPPHDVYLPGGGTEVYVDPVPRWPVEHRNVRALHGALTAIAGDGHDTRWPNFSIVPWPRGTLGWGVYWRTDAGARLAGGRVEGRLFDRPTEFRFGPLVRVRAPVVTKRGRRKVAIDAITPVTIQCADRSIDRVRPDAISIRSALTSNHYAARLGVGEMGAFDVESCCLEMVADETRVETVKLGAHASAKYGHVRGWVGRVVVECNAVAHWLLECAARGPGLGGRTAFGFGRVRVSPWQP